MLKSLAPVALVVALVGVAACAPVMYDNDDEGGGGGDWASPEPSMTPDGGGGGAFDDDFDGMRDGDAGDTGSSDDMNDRRPL